MWPTGTDVESSEALASQHNKILDWAADVIRIEAKSLSELSRNLDTRFVQVTRLIFNLQQSSQGRVIVSGVGKSGVIGRKWVSTFSSTGTPAFYLNPSEAAHGDLGAVTKHDLLLLLTNSGETAELFPVLRFAKIQGIPVIVVTGNEQSSMAEAATCVLPYLVEEEACPLGLAPTSSTTALAALGDALAVCQMKLKGFSQADFASFHPGGHLGRRLLLKVSDCMRKGSEVPLVQEDLTMDRVIVEMTEKKQGAAVVVNAHEVVVGIVTDGDLRRFLLKQGDIRSTVAREVMSKDPLMISPGRLALEARTLMESRKITQLVVSEEGIQRALGLVHIHDLPLARLLS